MMMPAITVTAQKDTYMKNSVMRLAIVPRVSVSYVEPAKPEYWDMRRLTKKWYWRGLEWLLKKLGATYRENVPEAVKFEERTIDVENVQRMISQSQRAMRELWHKRATTLIVGRDEMDRLMGNAPPEYLSFDAQISLGHGPELRWIPLKVVCCPWLEGWAILPDLKD